MKAFAVLAPATAARVPALERCQVTVHGTAVQFALLERPDVGFDAGDPALADAVLVRVEAFSCNYREQSRFLAVARDTDAKGFALLGSEFAGTVVNTGAAVTGLAPGDRVCGNGSVDVATGAGHPGLSTQRASAELQVHRAAKLMRLPAAMPLRDAAAFSVGAQTSYAILRRLGAYAQPHEAHVAVTASTSNTSLFAIRALAARGYRVHALTTSGAMAPALRALGREGAISCCVLARSEDPAPALRAYLAAQGIAGFDAVIDPFMDLYLSKLMGHLRRGGVYITCGVFDQFADGGKESFMRHGLGLEQIFSLLIRKNLTLAGNNLGNSADLALALDDHAAGRLPVAIDSVAGRGELEAFVTRTFLAPDRFGKVVFDYRAVAEPARVPAGGAALAVH